MKVLAALNGSPLAQDVLRAARFAASVLEAELEAIHVADDETEFAAEAARSAGVPMRIVSGMPAWAAIVARASQDDVVAVVVGARRLADDPRAAGSTAEAIITSTPKPVIVIPPDSVPRTPHIRRVLFPVEGSESRSRAAGVFARTLADAGIELLALHVLGAHNAPPMLDYQARDLQIWADEFAARYSVPSGDLLLMRGNTVDRILESARQFKADAVAIAWGQVFSHGHAQIVRGLLRRSTIPVILLPARGYDKVGRRSRGAREAIA